MPEIEKLRAEIDAIHAELVKLLNRRLSVAHQIWKIKKAEQKPFFDETREELILQKITKLSSEDALKQSFLRNVFKTILSESRSYLAAQMKNHDSAKEEPK